MAGNEANFFVRDATNGSTLPFRIFPGAPSNSINIEASTGDVGVGTTSPDSALHVKRTTADPGNLLHLEATDAPHELVYDGTNGRLGVGTTAPAFELEVVGDIGVPQQAA